MTLHCSERTVAGAHVVALAGTVDLSTVAELRDHLLRAVTSHPGETIAVDVDEVISLDDTGLGIILGLAGRAREGGGDLRLVCSSERLRQRLSLTGADRAVEVTAKLDAGGPDDG